MASKTRQAIWVCGALLLFAAVVLWFLLLRESYFLNRAVRQVSLRLSQFGRLSFIRNENYRFQFHRDGYIISVLPADTGHWEVFVRHKYPDRIKASLEDLEVVLEKEEIVSFILGGRKITSKPFIILHFFPKGKESIKRGMIFYQKGYWRVLD